MVRQYLDTLQWETTGEPTYDADGNPILPTPVQMKTINCRYENFMSSNRVSYRGRNNEEVLATGVVYVKKGETVPERFTVVSLSQTREGHTNTWELECLNVYHGQLNITIHVTENVGN